MKEIKGHTYAREPVLTVVYSDDTTEKFLGVSEEQHMAFIRSGLDKDGQPVAPTAEQQDEMLTKFRK